MGAQGGGRAAGSNTTSSTCLEYATLRDYKGNDEEKAAHSHDVSELWERILGRGSSERARDRLANIVSRAGI